MSIADCKQVWAWTPSETSSFALGPSSHNVGAVLADGVVDARATLGHNYTVPEDLDALFKIR